MNCRLPDIKKETKQYVLSEEFWTEIVWPTKKLSEEHLRLARLIINRYLEEYPFLCCEYRLDKKLGTGRAGGLTRRLVLAGWGWTVKAGDCGNAKKGKHILINCGWRNKKVICSACYRKIFGFDQIPDGYPAGLIAARSFGERGTQLSMQSFHTAERQLSVDDVVSLLNGKDPVPHLTEKKTGYNWFIHKSDAKEFVTRIRQEKGYKNIDNRHLLLIWLTIHSSDKKTLKSAWENNRSALSALVGPGQWQAMLTAIREEWHDDFSSPFVKLMTSQSPADFTN